MGIINLSCANSWIYVLYNIFVSENKRSAIEELSLVMRWKLREARRSNAGLINSLGWLGSEREGRNLRAEDFKAVNQRLNELMANPGSIPEGYRDVALLAQKLNGKKIPSLEEVRREFYKSKETAMITSAVIEKAVKEYPAWAKVNPEYPSQGTPASGALIEGFGAFLGTFLTGGNEDTEKVSQINRLFVLGFEAVLINENPESPLLRDVIGWMQEEISSFPENLHSKIAEAALRLRQTKDETATAPLGGASQWRNF